MAFGGFGAAAVGAHNPNKDFEVPTPIPDSVSSLAFSPTSNLLCAGTWSNDVMVWDVQQDMQSGRIGAATAKAAIKHQAPVLDVAWKSDGAAVFSASCDKTVKMWTLGQPDGQVVAQHDAPIKCVAYVPTNNLIATGSWDKTLKYWDLRTPNPACNIQLPERVYCMDVKKNLAVVATANKQVMVFDLRNPSKPFRDFPSPLKYQSRCVSCFTMSDKLGFALGSIEGRVAIHHVEAKDQKDNFAFKCHRQKKNTEVYPVNSINFHPKHGTFATTGSDGTVNFWDKDSKQRLKCFETCNAPIPCGAWNAPGMMFAYAVCYDWYKGSEHHDPATAKCHILIHATPDTEIRPRQKKKF